MKVEDDARPTPGLPVISDNSFSENVFYPHKPTDSMEPPQTKKQQIKNQKQKGASDHRLGSAKHTRLAVATNGKRIRK